MKLTRQEANVYVDLLTAMMQHDKSNNLRLLLWEVSSSVVDPDRELSPDTIKWLNEFNATNKLEILRSKVSWLVAYKTTDGQLFEDVNKAVNHQLTLENSNESKNNNA